MLTYTPLASYAGVFRGYVFLPSQNPTSSLKKLVLITQPFLVSSRNAHAKNGCVVVLKASVGW